MGVTRVVKIVAAIALLGVVFAIGRWGGTNEEVTVATISHPAPNVTTIQVPVEELTPEVVEEYIDPENAAYVDDLLAENRNLEVLVAELSMSLATATSEGGGTAVVTPIETPLSETTFTALSPEAPVVQPTRVAFKDFRLDFLAEGTEASYTLTQKFLILNTTGRNEDNVPTNLIRLYEIGPGTTRTSIPVTETTTIAAANTAAHWYIKFGVQGGVGQVAGWRDAGSAFVAVPWLKRGNNRSTEKTRWAFATPALAYSDNETSIGVLPMSLNLGTIMSNKHPLTNLWASPYIGITVNRGATRFGGLFSVTF